MENSGFLRTGLISVLHRTAAIAAMAVVVAMFGANVAQAAENEAIFMRTGSEKLFKVAFPVARMSADNANVVVARLPNDADKTKVLLTAKADGTATVTLRGEAADAAATFNIVVLNLLPDDVQGPCQDDPRPGSERDFHGRDCSRGRLQQEGQRSD